jgi:hypothetical protein
MSLKHPLHINLALDAIKNPKIIDDKEKFQIPADDS